MIIATFCFLIATFAPSTSFLLFHRHPFLPVPNISRQQKSLCATTIEETAGRQMANVCKYCGEEFDSRNKLFHHLRSSSECYSRAKQSMENSNIASTNIGSIQLQKRKVAVNFGYYGLDPRHESTSINEDAAEVVRRSFFLTMRNLYPKVPIEEEDGDTTFTLASAARLRHPSLMQEKSCNAWSDVVGFTYMGGPNYLDIAKIVNWMQNIIEGDEILKDSSALSFIQVLSVESLMASTKFHAEKSCSQRAYQYLMPTKWLDDDNDTRHWIRQKAGVGGHQNKLCATPPSIVRFKKVLKLAESRDVTEIRSVAVSSAGRFGKLWQKERRPLHNFCDPSGGVIASPSNQHVWRSVDKIRLVGFAIDKNNSNETFIVIELKGDGFVKQQVRRIIGSALAISNGWLPFDFFDVAMRKDISIETPLAPAELMYMSSARFHFIDLVKGSSLFEKDCGENIIKEKWLDRLQSRIMQERLKNSKIEAIWLRDLKRRTSPRIKSRLERIKVDDDLKKEQLRLEQVNIAKLNEQEVDFSTSEAPEMYHKVLSLLRNVCIDEQWPMTSNARSRLIRSPKPGNARNEQFNQRAASSQFLGHLSQCGSFTIVNPKLSNVNLPMANKLFPELVDAAFELEALCSTSASQSCLKRNEESIFIASTHCAINRNVEYTPHFDNGKGKEQTFSTIVGLGNYTGGELIVDGDSYNIRYNNLKFDGWKQIHSTAPYIGERFSLVWFTPEKREDYMLQEETSYEDTKAKTLIRAHTHSLPNYSVLKFRHNSTDALVINEILDINEGCTYELSPKAWCSMAKNDSNNSPTGFSLKGHAIVLDIGAHIGVFGRYALSTGCQKIIAYEPEKQNLELLRQNLHSSDSTRNEEHNIDIHNFAIAHGKPGTKSLIHARNRTDGSLNTWRHSLEEYSQYIDKIGVNLPSEKQSTLLTRCKVQTVPLFGPDGALVPGVSFVKIDCEGAELDILLSPDSSLSSSWKDVTHLVFEWSFTKERRVNLFHKATKNLESAGFTVVYEGKDSWWDTEINCMWPYHSDLVVFAKRTICSSPSSRTPTFISR